MSCLEAAMEYQIRPHERAALDARGIKPIPFDRPDNCQFQGAETSHECWAMEALDARGPGSGDTQAEA